MASVSSQTELTAQLAQSSTPYQDPVGRVRWELLDLDQYWLPPEAISLHGVPEFLALPEAQRVRLSQYEFLNVLEVGLWLEGLFMERIARSFARADTDRAALRYRLHELREEAGHSLMFLELMARSGLSLPRRCRPRAFLAHVFGRYAPLESPAFWMATLIGEEFPDRFNRYIRRRAGSVCPVIVDISTVHMIDEARHITYARELLRERFARLSLVRRHAVRDLVERLVRQFTRLLYYPKPALYALSGLEPGSSWAALARASAQRREFVEACIGPTLKLLREAAIEVRRPLG